MHSAFGFIQPPRYMRDPTFTGSSSNPSKRSTVIATRPPARAAAAHPVVRINSARPATTAATAPQPQRGVVAAPPVAGAAVLLEKRCAYLEKQCRGLSAQLVDLADAVSSPTAPLRLRARVLRPAAEFPAAAGGTDPAGDIAAAGAQDPPPLPPVPAGTAIHLVYPMHSVQLPSGHAAVVMRRLQVDPHTAQPADSWVVVHRSAGKGRKARYLVGEFELG